MVKNQVNFTVPKNISFMKHTVTKNVWLLKQFTQILTKNDRFMIQVTYSVLGLWKMLQSECQQKLILCINSLHSANEY